MIVSCGFDVWCSCFYSIIAPLLRLLLFLKWMNKTKVIFHNKRNKTETSNLVISKKQIYMWYAQSQNLESHLIEKSLRARNSMCKLKT